MRASELEDVAKVIRELEETGDVLYLPWVRVFDILQMQVQHGAITMDQVRPGWYREIDQQLLDLGNDRCCIVGHMQQRSGGQEFLLPGFPDEDYPVELGMDTDDDLVLATDRSHYELYSVLTELWLVEIKQRIRGEAARESTS